LFFIFSQLSFPQSFISLFFSRAFVNGVDDVFDREKNPIFKNLLAQVGVKVQGDSYDPSRSGAVDNFHFQKGIKSLKSSTRFVENPSFSSSFAPPGRWPE
jgi:hypothetical protein